MSDELSPSLFQRMDESDDGLFYAQPRLVTHIDDSTIARLREFYAELLPEGADLLDLMSSWVSHLPEEGRYGRRAGIGMNSEELAANRQLDEWLVHDLNADPELPYADASFDAVLNTVSVQYLTRPIAVFASIARVLRPGGVSIVAMSHRCFPTKAIRAFHAFGRDQRFELVSQYHSLAGGFLPAEHLDRSPESGDPLWIVSARKAE
jgi:SAM-dependent methyltransferase